MLRARIAVRARTRTLRARRPAAPVLRIPTTPRPTPRRLMTAVSVQLALIQLVRTHRQALMRASAASASTSPTRELKVLRFHAPTAPPVPCALQGSVLSGRPAKTVRLAAALFQAHGCGRRLEGMQASTDLLAVLLGTRHKTLHTTHTSASLASSRSTSSIPTRIHA